jgi:Spy/CpxP family protein refolding chaperone
MGQSDGSNNSSGSANVARRRRRGWIATAAIALTVVVGTGALVYAQDRSHEGWSGSVSPDRIAGHIEHGVKYLLSDVDATAEQRTQVTTILQSTATDVHALADQHIAARKQLHEILSAPTIDRERLEAVRVDELRLADEASKRLLTGIADAADVLTPEQRATLAQSMEEHRHWRHGWH